nr:hypothetical protein [Tanacetum cinerariifolium]
SGTLPSNTITNPKEDLKGITTRSGVAYQGPTIPTLSKVVKQGTEVTKDQVQTPSSQSTAPVQPSVVQSETQTLVSEPVIAPEDPLEDPTEVPMANNQTMAELLQAPTKGYEDAMVIPEIAANNFELKHARIWLEKEPPRSILTWDDLITKFINQFFPPSKTTNLRNEIMRFQQRFDESFYEAWDRFNDLLRACPHHGFFELRQLDTFYNALNVNDQDSLNTTAVIAKVSTSSSTPAISSEVSELKDMVRALLLDKKKQSSALASSSTPAPVKAVEPNCVTCGANYNQRNTGFRPQMVANQIRPPSFPPHQNNQNNFNRGNNFDKNRGGNFNQSNFNQGGNFNQGQLHRPQVNQPPAYQAPAYQAPIPQTKSMSQTNFESYIKANDAVLRNMQNQCQGLQTQIANLTDMLPKFVSSNTASSSGPTIPTLSKVVKQGTEVTKDQVQTPSSQSTATVQPPVTQSETQTPVSEPIVAPVTVPMPNLKPSILYPLRRDNERRIAELKDMVRALLLDKKNQSSTPTSSPTPALVKVVKPNCVTCGGSGTLPSNTITKPKEELKGITTRCGVAYQGPKIPTPSKVVKQGTEPIVAPVSALMPNLKSSISYPLRRDNKRRRDQANEQIEKFYEIFKDTSFEISFNALILMPKFSSTLKALIGNKEKLSEMARTPMNEHCSMIILNNLPRKLGDPGKFLIPCEFPVMDECLALANLDFEPDLRVPLILRRCFLKTGRALIDVHKGKLTLHIRNEAITYNLDQTVRYSANYNQITANKIDVIVMAYEEYSQEVLGFFDVTASGNPTPYDDPIVSTTSPTLTLFGDSDFLLFEEADAFLSLED